MIFGGFGNISGDVDIWELNSLERIAKFNSATSVYIEWSLDGKYVMIVRFKNSEIDKKILTFLSIVWIRF